MTNTDDGKAFGAYLGDMSNMCLVAHGVGLGGILGLFDIMVEQGKATTSHEIAAAGNFKERYVREWLGLMVVGRVIDYDAETKTYSIPEHRIPYLTKQGKEKNMAVFMKGLSISTSISSQLEECFKKDGPPGIPYSSYKEIWNWRGTQIQVNFPWDFIEKGLKLVPGLMVKLESGISVCDVGCSTAHQMISIAEHYPKSTFLGLDIAEDGIQKAIGFAKQKGLSNATFAVQDACNMPSDWSDKYDALFVWDVVHDVPHSKRLLTEILRVLKPGGVFFMMDINLHTELSDNMSHPGAPTYYGLSLFHCMVVSLYHEGGEGLGTAWGIEKQRQYLEEAGFVDIEQIHPQDSVHSYFIAYKKS